MICRYNEFIYCFVLILSGKSRSDPYLFLPEFRFGLTVSVLRSSSGAQLAEQLAVCRCLSVKIKVDRSLSLEVCIRPVDNFSCSMRTVMTCQHITSPSTCPVAPMTISCCSGNQPKKDEENLVGICRCHQMPPILQGIKPWKYCKCMVNLRKLPHKYMVDGSEIRLTS